MLLVTYFIGDPPPLPAHGLYSTSVHVSEYVFVLAQLHSHITAEAFCLVAIAAVVNRMKLTPSSSTEVQNTQSFAVTVPRIFFSLLS